MPDISPLHSLAKVPSGGSLEDALADSLTGMQFIDTTFYAFTRRLPSGKADKPRAVQANSRILKASSTYFRGLLSGPSYSASPKNAFSRGPLSPSDTYEYDSDSDLEDDDDIIGSLLATPSEISLKDDTEDKPPASLPSDSNSGTIGINHLGCTRVVPLDSVAADTLEAMIFYIYTGNIYFLPLRSRGAKVREKAKATHSMNHPKRPACSCKSIYRFAHEVGFEGLENQAEEYLFSQLDAENILDELFSRFSSRYTDILQRQTARLHESYWTPPTMDALGPRIQSIVRGEMPHAASAYTLLLQQIPPTPICTPMIYPFPPGIATTPAIVATATISSPPLFVEDAKAPISSSGGPSPSASLSNALPKAAGAILTSQHPSPTLIKASAAPTREQVPEHAWGAPKSPLRLETQDGSAPSRDTEDIEGRKVERWKGSGASGKEKKKKKET